jgi:hypothetical protein
LPCRLVTRPQWGKAPHLPRLARGRLSHRSWGRRLMTTCALLLRHGGGGAAEGRATSPLVADAKVDTPPRAADTGGASAGDVGATTTPAVIDVDPICAVPGGADDLVRDQPQIDLAPEVQKCLAHRYLHLRLRAQGCHGARLIGITPLGRRTGLKTSRTCKPCEPASSPSTPR